MAVARVPKILHFIWAGGPDSMPEAGLANVAAWRAAQPDFEAWIWIDERSDPAARARYAARLGAVTVVDITAAGVALPEVRYELDALWPNHGAASDLLRYAILERFGGMYIDCLDVFPNPRVELGGARFSGADRDAGRAVFATELPAPRLLLHETRHAIGFDAEGPGTEAMVCTAGNPAMRRILEDARGAYRGRKWSHKLLTFRLDAASTPPRPAAPGDVLARALHAWGRPLVTDTLDVVKQRARDTLDLTGPGRVLATLSALGDRKEHLQSEAAGAGGAWVTLPDHHALSWAPMRIVPLPYAEALERAVVAIAFEADAMQLLNLEVHVELVRASAADAPARERVAQDLFERLARDAARFLVEPRFAGAGLLRQLVIRR